MPEINIIPMIDIMFFLLVFFMMSTLYMVQVKTVDVDMPQAASAETQLAVSYVVSGVGVIGQATFRQEDTAAVFLLIADFLLCAVTLFYLLFSYVFHSPEYLVTEEGVQALRREAEMQAQRAARFAPFAAPPQPGQPTYPPQMPGAPAEPDPREDIADRLIKLKNLYDAGVISGDEYQEKRRELLSRL